MGFICGGSLVEQLVTCGNPNCPCSRDPEKLHGPYFQLSWKEKAKSVSRFLSSEEAALYQEWINNRNKLTAIIEDMYDISLTPGISCLCANIPGFSSLFFRFNYCYLPVK